MRNFYGSLKNVIWAKGGLQVANAYLVDGEHQC